MSVSGRVEAVDGGEFVGVPGGGGDGLTGTGGVGVGVDRLVLLVGQPGQAGRPGGQVVLVDDRHPGCGELGDLGLVGGLGGPVGPEAAEDVVPAVGVGLGGDGEQLDRLVIVGELGDGQGLSQGQVIC
jgi:hypothetical protein